MRRLLTIGTLTTLIATGAQAGGLDRNGQPISFIFEEGTFIELGIGSVSASVSGVDYPLPPISPGGGFSGNIAKPFAPLSFSIKTDLTEKLSFGIIYDEPFGAEVSYGAGSALFGGTTARAEITAVTALLRYKFTDRFSAHGGIRIQTGDASVNLTSGAYGLLSGYNVNISPETAFGYVVGAAYEIPEYFLRVALTYNSAITHDVTNVETGPLFPITISETQTTLPQSLNLEFQSGIAPKTFVFGGARWVEWSKLAFEPPVLFSFSGEGIVEFEDTITYSLGIGRQFSDRWTGLFSLIYEPSGNPLVSPLAPVNGFWGASLGAVYTNKNMRVTAGINYTKLGDATPEIDLPLAPDTPVASFTDNSSVGVGLKVGWSF